MGYVEGKIDRDQVDFMPFLFYEMTVQEIREALNAELISITTELSGLLQERANYDDFSAKGLEVTHKTFGNGIVTAHNGNMLTIQFVEQEKRFQMPQGFSNGFLKTNSEEIMQLFNEIAEVEDKIIKAKNQQSSIQRQ